MNIKNGFIYKTNSFLQVDTMVAEYRKAIAIVSNELIENHFSKTLAGFYDYLSLDPKERKPFEFIYQKFMFKSNIKTVYQTIYDYMKDYEYNLLVGIDNSAQDIGIDFSCSLNMYTVGNYFLFILNSSQQKYKDIFLSIEGIEEYSYSDDAKPDNISDEMWSLRKEDWEIAINNGSPERSGYVIPCYYGLPMIMPDKILQVIEKNLTLDVRATNYATRMIHYDFMLNNKQDYPSRYREADAYIKSPHGQIAIQSKKEELMNRFSPSIGREEVLKRLYELGNL